MTPPTNTELLENRIPAGLLTGIEGQRRFLLRVFTQPKPCPICAEPFDRIQAAGVELDAYDVGGSERPAENCPHCDAPVVYTLPLIGDWYWRVDRDRATVSFAPKA